MTADAIRTHGLTCYFGNTPVVRGLDLCVPTGCIYGFLGRNGAGKTTCIRMLLGLLPPTRGTGTILGQPITAIPPLLRARIGYVSERHPVYPWMRVADWEGFNRSFYPLWKDAVFTATLEHFRISRTGRIRALSRGQQAGLCLATTLAQDPELLILDDPTLGLDPIARAAFLEAIIFLTRSGSRTVFFSSHFLGDVDRVADRIGILDEGRLIADCAMDTFRDRVRRVVLRPLQPLTAPPKPPALLASRLMDGSWELTYVAGSQDEPVFTHPGCETLSQSLSLEEAFIAYLGERGAATSLLQRMEGAA